MLRLPARLPDPLVGLLPDLGGARGLGLHDRPQSPRQPLAPARVQEDRVERGAEDVVLPLIERPVPDPDGMGARVPGELVPGRFGQVATAVDPVHDLQPAVRVRLQVGHELHELLRLPVEVEEVERLQRERRVPDPGEPVVPVAFPARGLGQRCRQRRHGRPRRHVREALDRQRGALDRFPPSMVRDARPVEPGPPEPDGRRDPGLGVVDVARGLQLVCPRQGAVRAVAGVQDGDGPARGRPRCPATGPSRAGTSGRRPWRRRSRRSRPRGSTSPGPARSRRSARTRVRSRPALPGIRTVRTSM